MQGPSQTHRETLLHNLRARYTTLENSVNQVLLAAVGDSTRIQLQVNAVAAYTHAFQLVRFVLLLRPPLIVNVCSLHQHRHLFSAEILDVVESNLLVFKQKLFRASMLCSDPSPHPPVVASGATAPPTGRRGRPKADIDDDLLRHLTTSNYGGPAQIARVFGHSTRTITRRQQDLGLREPGLPPQQVAFLTCPETQDKTLLFRHNHAGPRMSDITDWQLDETLALILEDHPRYGRAMLLGALHTLGHRVQRERVEQSYLRVYGPPRVFGSREIVRRGYSSPGANAVWHHDGNHSASGLIFCEIQPSHFPFLSRSHTMEVRHPRICRRFGTSRPRYASLQQQSRPYGPPAPP